MWLDEINKTLKTFYQRPLQTILLLLLAVTVIFFLAFVNGLGNTKGEQAAQGKTNSPIEVRNALSQERIMSNNTVYGNGNLLVNGDLNVLSKSTRNISQEQKEGLLNDLKSFSYKEIEIAIAMGDRESFQFATLIRNIFIEAGWEVNGEIVHIIPTRPITGLFIAVKNVDEDAESLDRLLEVFNKNDFPFRWFRNSDQQERFRLIIGAEE